LGQVLILLRRSVLSFYTRARYWVKKTRTRFWKTRWCDTSHFQFKNV
jgi:hypothetical protein